MYCDTGQYTTCFLLSYLLKKQFDMPQRVQHTQIILLYACCVGSPTHGSACKGMHLPPSLYFNNKRIDAPIRQDERYQWWGDAL